MSVFDRFGNLVKGSVERAVGDLERNNPEAVYESALDDGKARLAAHRASAAGLVVQRTRRQEALDATERDLRLVIDGWKGAVDEGDDDTAIVLLARQEELVAQLERESTELLELTRQVEQSKDALRAYEASLVALGREKTSALANHAAAEAAIDVQEAMSGVSDSTTAKALDSVRDSVGALERRAHDGYLDADGESIRGRAGALGRKAAEQSAADQLEALKRTRKKL